MILGGVKMSRFSSFLGWVPIIVLAILTASCAPQPIAPAGTATAEPENIVPAEIASEIAPTIVPDEMRDISTAVAARTPVPTPTPGRVDQEIAEFTAEMGVSGQTFLGVTVEDWIDVGISALIILVGIFLGVRLLTALLKRLTERSTTELDNKLLEHLKPDLRLLVVLVVTRFALLRLDFLSDSFRKIVQDVYFLLGLVIVTTIGVRLIRYIADWYKASLESDEDRTRLNPIILSVQRILILFLFIIMLSVGLSHFGVNLGVLSITLLVMAVILSLGAKDVIADVISGFVILVDQPFRVHDGLQIREFDTWGDVVQIGTRTTRILTRDNREVIIPNTKLLNSKIINFTYPEPVVRMQVDLRIAYDTDLEKAREVIKNALSGVDGVLHEKEVDVFLIGFGDTARELRVRWWIGDYHLQFPTLDKACTAIDSALEQSGIEIPITVYDLNVRMERDREESQG
jgi:small-conductance mechanosensitive channel